MRRHLMILIVVLSLVALAFAGCQDLQGVTTEASATPNLTTPTPTGAPAETLTTQELVLVPSYTDFRSTYTGDDWEQVLAAWKAAIQDGFSQAGLVAEIELIAPGETQSQDPPAGSMVPRGTVVHIRVTVYD